MFIKLNTYVKKTCLLFFAVVILIIAGCSECVSDPKFFKKSYHWVNLSPLTSIYGYIDFVDSFEKNYEFNPRWFPMATAPNVGMTFDRENSEVRFEYLMGETHVTEIWKITKLTRDQASREDECPPFSE